MKPTNTACHAIYRQLLADGITHMFGNPGTVEQGFLDALADFPEMKYILTLQESVAVMCADGYARASQKPALVQLHSSPGIGNAVGALYQAKRGHAPLVVIAGDAGVKYMNMDAQMAADLVGMMEPVTKYATMVLDPRHVLRTLRRAIRIAATPPMGPVYVCLPADIMDAVNDEPVFPSGIPSTRTVPSPELIAQTADWLCAARRPMIYAGDGVAWSQAQAELAEVAELLGAEVYGADEGELNLDQTHPCYQGMTGHMFGEHSRGILKKGDVNLVVGTYMVPEVFPDLGDIWAEGARVAHIDLNSYEIGKNHRVDLGMVADPKLSLRALAEVIRARQTTEQRRSAQSRVAGLAAAKESSRAAQLAADDALIGREPLFMAEFARALAQRLPKGAVIFDEALTNSPALLRYLPPRLPGHYFLTRGGSLGVGIPGAIGAKLACPDKTVLGFSGDGGSMYTIQALYTAAKYALDVTFVICHNRRYKLLDLNIQQYWSEQGIPAHAYPSPFDLSQPPLGFCDMARGMGLGSVRVERAEQIMPAIEQALQYKGPFLIDLIVS